MPEFAIIDAHYILGHSILQYIVSCRWLVAAYFCRCSSDDTT